MKRIIYLAVIATLVACNVMVQAQDARLNVMTFNIRMDNKNDGDQQWSNRKDFAANTILFYECDLVGAQEVFHHQLTDLLDRMPGYNYIGVGREDGKTKGEYSPILYKKDRFEVIRSGNFWLSEQPTAVGKKGWDAACERVATWGIFKDKQSGKSFFMLNTHLDHMGTVARREGAKLVLEQAKVLSNNHPIIVTGDFNATMHEEPIEVLTNNKDSRYLTSSRMVSPLVYGPEWSFHDWGKIPEQKRTKIDYIFIKGKIGVSRNGILTEKLNNLYVSDHCPMISTLLLK